jgi:hypothetical protein
MSAIGIASKVRRRHRRARLLGAGLCAAGAALAQAPVAVDIDGGAEAFVFAGAAPAGRIAFYVDGQRLLERTPGQAFGHVHLALASGPHVFRFAVEIEDPRGGAGTMEDDCAGQFALPGPARLHPRLEFVLRRPTPGKLADYLACSLLPQAP